MRQTVLLLLTLLLFGCRSDHDQQQAFSLQGAWMLQQITTPEDHTYPYDASNGTWLRFYQGDSILYECWLTQTEQALIVAPQESCGVMLIEKGGGEYLYLENEDPRPLNILNDSTITIQRMGRIYTWQRNDSIAQEWSEEILSLAKRDLTSSFANSETHSYVLSAKERHQASSILIALFLVPALAGRLHDVEVLDMRNIGHFAPHRTYNRNHIETVGIIDLMIFDIVIDRFAQVVTFLSIDRLNGIAKITVAACLHLYKHNRVAILRNDINVAMHGVPVASQNHKSLLSQIAGRQFFTPDTHLQMFRQFFLM